MIYYSTVLYPYMLCPLIAYSYMYPWATYGSILTQTKTTVKDYFSMQAELIKFLCSRKKYQKYFQYVKPSGVSEETYVILKDIGEYFDINDNNEVQYSEFSTWFNVVKHPILKDEKRKLYNATLDRLQGLEIPEYLENSIISRFLREDYAAQIADIANRVAEGDSNASIEEIQVLLEGYQQESSKVSQKASHELSWDVDDIMDSVLGKEALHWRTDAIEDSLGPIDKGDLLYICGRPDTGKTRLALSEATYMASQLPEGKRMMWVNNEERGKKMQSRIIAATLGWTVEQVEKDRHKAFEEYTEIMGVQNKVMFLDDSKPNQPLTMREIEKYLQENSIGLLVIDQLWKVPTPGKDISDVSTQTYLSNYARHLAKTYCPVIGIYQLDGSAEGEKYPRMNQIYYSKTAVQGESDGIIMLGRSYGFGEERTRYLSFPKNKLDFPRKPELRSAQHEVTMKAEIFRFVSEDMYE